jgi:homoisocitrate dehydrogenase
MPRRKPPSSFPRKTDWEYVKEERSFTDAEGNITAEATRRITSVASKRIAETAYALASQRGNRNSMVTVIHKANVLSVTDGLFRTCCREVYDAGKWGDKGVKYSEQIVDSMVYKLFRDPSEFDVIVAPNLYGDILSYLSFFFPGVVLMEVTGQQLWLDLWG